MPGCFGRMGCVYGASEREMERERGEERMDRRGKDAAAWSRQRDDIMLQECTYVARSSSDSTGQLMAPTMWSSAYSDGDRTSMIVL
jgi:hypothetical protein